MFRVVVSSVNPENPSVLPIEDAIGDDPGLEIVMGRENYGEPWERSFAARLDLLYYYSFKQGWVQKYFEGPEKIWIDWLLNGGEIPFEESDDKQALTLVPNPHAEETARRFKTAYQHKTRSMARRTCCLKME